MYPVMSSAGVTSNAGFHTAAPAAAVGWPPTERTSSGDRSSIGIAAPLSSFDADIPDGSRIPIEERAADEVTGYRGTRWAPEGVAVRNPAFDVTPAELITGLITEKGVVLEPTRQRIAALLSAPARTGSAR